jgi:hypothetical protein
VNDGAVRKRQSGPAQTRTTVGSTPTCVTLEASSIVRYPQVGHWQAQVPVKHPPLGAMQVQLLPGGLQRVLSTARSFIGSGHQSLKLERRVRLPHGSLVLIQVEHGQVV